MLVSTFRRPGGACRWPPRAGSRRPPDENRVEHRDERIAAFQAEALLPTYLVCRKDQCLGLIELVQDAKLLLAIWANMRTLDLAWIHEALIGILNVHVFDAHCAGVGVARTRRMSRTFIRVDTEATSGEDPVNGSKGSNCATSCRDRDGKADGPRADQCRQAVSANTVGVDDLLHAGGLAEIGLMVAEMSGPADGLWDMRKARKISS